MICAGAGAGHAMRQHGRLIEDVASHIPSGSLGGLTFHLPGFSQTFSRLLAQESAAPPADENDMDDTEDDAVSEDTIQIRIANAPSFPPRKSLISKNHQVPCTDLQGRMRIATRRAPQQSNKTFLTNALVSALDMVCYPWQPFFIRARSTCIAVA